MCEYECSFPRITISSSCFNMCSGVANMKTVREFNIAQKSIVNTVMHTCKYLCSVYNLFVLPR